MDILQRGARLFDRLIVAILRNEAKQPLFSVAERVAMLRESTADLCNVEINSFTGLLADYAKAKHATVLLRGIRAVSDYEYEAAMSLMNRRLAPEIETVCLIASDGFSFVSSRLVKEVAALGGDVSGLVPSHVEAMLKMRRQSAKLVRDVANTEN